MKKYGRRIGSLLAAVALLFTLLPAVAVRAEGKTYTVTLRAGNVATFDTARMQSVEGQVEITENYIRFQVTRGESLVSMGYFDSEAGFNSIIQNAVIVDGNYALKSMDSIAELRITSNQEYVLDYGKLVDPVEYSIYFVDSVSGEQVAAPTLAYGNAGDIIEAVPLTLNGYETTDTATRITLEKEKENSVSFVYTYVGGTVVTNIVPVLVPGDTITNTTYRDVPGAVEETPVLPAGAADGQQQGGAVVIPDDQVPLADNAAGNNDNAANGNDENANEDGNGENIVSIEEEEVPLADGAEDETVLIEDEETPLASGGEPVEKMNVIPIAAGVAVVAVLGIAATAVVLKKKKTDR